MAETQDAEKNIRFFFLSNVSKETKPNGTNPKSIKDDEENDTDSENSRFDKHGI